MKYDSPVLLVDDNDDIRKLVRMTLETVGDEVFEASDGWSALEMARLLQVKIVLLDIMMPGELDGLEVCSRIKNDPYLCDTPVILISGLGQQSDIEAGKRAGADDYMVKPFSPLQLLDKVRELTRGEP